MLLILTLIYASISGFYFHGSARISWDFSSAEVLRNKRRETFRPEFPG